MKWASWVTLVAGLWLIIAPFVLRYTAAAATTNDVILGILIAACSIWIASADVGSGPAWLISLFGIWMILAPFVLGFSGYSPTTSNGLTGMLSRAASNDIVTGFVVFIFGIVRAATGVRRPGTSVA